MRKWFTRRAAAHEATLARLADRSLPAAREAALRAEVRREPELEAALAEQEQAVALLRSLRETAPASLRARVAQTTRPATRQRVRRRPVLLSGALAAAAAAAAAIAVLVLGGGGTAAPSLSQAARLAVAPATRPAPAPADGVRLRLALGGIPFPNWTALHLTTTGARIDTLRGRRVDTVFYTTRTGRRIGYAIVSGPPLAEPAGRTETVYGVRYTLTHRGATRLVSWVRNGHTCIIAGTAAPAQTLLDLAEDQSV